MPVEILTLQSPVSLSAMVAERYAMVVGQATYPVAEKIIIATNKSIAMAYSSKLENQCSPVP